MFADRARSGGPCVTSVPQDNCIGQGHLCDRFVTAKSTSHLVVSNGGCFTVQNRLREQGILCLRPYCGIVLSRCHRQLRANWACNHCGQHWQTVVFSKVSCFNLLNADGCIILYEYRRCNERYARNCVVQHKHYGGGGVMVSAAINYRFKSELVECQGNLTTRCYINQILRPVVVPMFRQCQGLAFWRDNARLHVAGVTRDFFQANNTDFLPWQACSPDCNSIEHARDYLAFR